jgi:hypothetical protein
MLGSKNCCMSCHEDAESGYGPMLELYDELSGEYKGEVCCRVLKDFDKKIAELLNRI